MVNLTASSPVLQDTWRHVDTYNKNVQKLTYGISQLYQTLADSTNVRLFWGARTLVQAAHLYAVLDYNLGVRKRWKNSR